MRYRYYLLNRPPGIGTHPPGAVDKKVWLPRQAIPSAEQAGYDRQAFGYVSYDSPLPLAQIWQYELEPDPDDLYLWLAYRYWLDAGRSPQEAEWLIRDAWQADPRHLTDPVDLVLLAYKVQGGHLADLLAVLGRGGGE
jgi:hypothetical protein